MTQTPTPKPQGSDLIAELRESLADASRGETGRAHEIIDLVAEALTSREEEVARLTFILALALVRAQFAEGNRVLAANHAETLRGIAGMNPETEGSRMVQWAREGLWGYVETPEATMKELIDRANQAEFLLALMAACAEEWKAACERRYDDACTANTEYLEQKAQTLSLKAEVERLKAKGGTLIAALAVNGYPVSDAHWANASGQMSAQARALHLASADFRAALSQSTGDDQLIERARAAVSPRDADFARQEREAINRKLP